MFTDIFKLQLFIIITTCSILLAARAGINLRTATAPTGTTATTAFIT